MHPAGMNGEPVQPQKRMRDDSQAIESREKAVIPATLSSISCGRVIQDAPDIGVPEQPDTYNKLPFFYHP
jgi:hypothetical protein